MNMSMVHSIKEIERLTSRRRGGSGAWTDMPVIVPCSRSNRHSHFSTPARMSGLSLVELMVALLISTLIMISLVGIFSTTRQTYQSDEGLARLQENSRFAMQFLGREIRMVGDLGCVGQPSTKDIKDGRIINYLPTSSAMFDVTTQPWITGFDANGPTAGGSAYSLPTLYPPTLVSSTNPSLDAGLVPNGAVDGSDVLVMRYMDGERYPLVAPYSDNTSVYAQTPNTFGANQILVATRCGVQGPVAAIFQASSVSTGGGGSYSVIAHTTAGTPGNICNTWGTGSCPASVSSQPGGNGFTNGSEIAAFRTVVYYIGRGGTAANGAPSLYRNVFEQTGVVQSEELVEGVENMQVAYGVGNTSSTLATSSPLPTDTLTYVPASMVTDWTKVKTVRLALLVATSNVTGFAETTAIGTTPFNMANMAQIVPPNDNRRRRVVTETFRIRNR